MITAREIQYNYDIESYDEGGYLGIDDNELSKMLIEFAKLHVKEALEAAINNNAIYCSEGDCYAVKRNDILNAYPDELIK